MCDNLICFRLSRARASSGRDALDGKHLLRQHAEDRRLIAAAGADLERLAQFAAGDQDLDHARHHEGLRNGLAETQGSAVSS
jgi:hypothetical protein